MIATKHPARLWSAITAAAALAGIAILLATAATQGSGEVAAQLERPATPAMPATPAATARALVVGPGAVHVRTTVGAYGVEMTLAPNRASARQSVRIVLTRAGHRVSGATVALGYSMPSMGMPQVFSSTLREQTNGGYRSSDPALAMPGTWRLTFRVAPPSGTPFTVAIDDRMHR